MEFQGRLGTIDSAQWILGPVMDNLNRLEGALAIIGLCYTTKILICRGWSLLKAARIYVFEPLFGRKTDFVREYGHWAVVTGATDGIGKEFARELANKGMNIVLISRSIEKLNKVAREIVTDYGVQTRVIPIDFSGDLNIYQIIAQELENIEVGILVNNVGVFPLYPMPTGDMDPLILWQHVTVNVGSVTMMTRLVLPKMRQRRKGGIINVASGASFEPTALMAAYSASKIFVDYFSEATRKEYERFGITIQCLTPFYIATNMTQYSDRIAKPSFFVPSARQYVKSALLTFGIVNSCMGYIGHAIQYGGLSLLPTSAYKLVTARYQRQLRVDAKAKNL